VNTWLGFWDVDVAPSLKFQDHEVGLPAEVSVNVTDCPAAGDDGVKVKEAVRAAATATVRVVLFEPDALVAVKVTVLDPAAAYVWLGFRVVEVAPSPKFQDHAVGVPVDVSVNATACPAVGEAGLYVNEAASATPTVTVRVVLFEPDALVAVRVTVFDPAVVYVWLGFRVVEVAPSPKFQDHAVGVPVDVSVNVTDCPAAGEAGL
jgi:hypothetical protein